MATVNLTLNSKMMGGMSMSMNMNMIDMNMHMNSDLVQQE